MARYADGDDAAFSELYAEVAPRLRAYLFRQTRDQHHSDDLTQQTLLRMHRARGTFLPDAQVMPWAIAIARRLVIDEVRRRSRRVQILEPREAPEAHDPHAISGYQHIHASQVAEHLERELARLPEGQREAFELLRLDGLTLCEAAAATGSTVSALKSRAHRAYEALRVSLQNNFGE